jgi:hypothetical protein
MLCGGLTQNDRIREDAASNEQSATAVDYLIQTRYARRRGR